MPFLHVYPIVLKGIYFLTLARATFQLHLQVLENLHTDLIRKLLIH